VNANFFDTLVFGTPGTASVRDYYSEISYGTLDIVTVDLPSSTGWQTAPRNYSYYVDGQYGFGDYPRNAQRMVEDVVALVDPLVDYSNYDNNGDDFVDALFVIHAGPGAEFTGSTNDIWSHAWSTNSPQLVDGVYVYSYSTEPEYWSSPGDMTIGVYAHELGHVLGLPDWYDYGYDSAGVGSWCLMSYGSWNGNLGDSPAHVSAEGRWRLGFVDAVPLMSDVEDLAIPQVETNQTNSVYYVWDNGAGNNEYFLLENRQQVGYDAALPSNGLLIWHVDTEMYGNENQCTDHQNCNCTDHYEVALEQADGDLDLEYYSNYGDTGDPYPGSTNNTHFNLESIPNSGSYNDCSSCVTVTNISSSSATMYADVSVACGQPVPDIKANGSDDPITISPTDTLSVTVAMNASGLTADADWWLLGKSQSGWYYYHFTKEWTPGMNVTYQGPLRNLPSREVLNRSNMPAGSYTVYFGVDLIMNGSLNLNQAYGDSVKITVNNP
jgi:immune inhibitor A